MLLQLWIVGNSPEAMLIQKARQRQICFQVNDCLIICLGVNLHILDGSIFAESGSKIRRFRGNRIKSLMRIRISVFFTSKPDIIGNSDDKWDDKSVASIE